MIHSYICKMSRNGIKAGVTYPKSTLLHNAEFLIAYVRLIFIPVP